MNLRDFLFGYQAGETIEPTAFSVYNTSPYSGGNGGRCCRWTVPAGKSYAVFEIWSGGGSGPGVCCCMQGGGAGSGGYAVKGCTVCPGDNIRICAASSGICPSPGSNQGCCGYCSYVCSEGGGGGNTWLAVVCGGRYAEVSSRCFYFSNCYGCCSMCWCCGGITNGSFDFCVPGTIGTAHVTQYCYDQGFSESAHAPYTAGGVKHGVGNCRSWHACCGNSSGTWPGSGGNSAQFFDNRCCGGEFGGQGMVYVVYY
tara:strand:- start:9558 stop:10322 length:765 start_codon:yes stop_codon:yes gene_type:complete